MIQHIACNFRIFPNKKEDETIKKKLAALAVCAVMSLSFVVSASAETVKIGVFEPATGINGASGMQETLGVKYTNEQIPTVSIGVETYDVELVIVDNESSEDEAAVNGASSEVSATSAMV